MSLLLLCLAAIASAFLPFIPIEALLVAAVATTPEAWWALAAVTTLGQMIGKTVIFALGRESMQWGWLRTNLQRHQIDRHVSRMSAAAERRPVAVDAVVLGSALTGIPPFAVTSLVAGQLGCSLARFVVAGSVGRFGRFAIVALGTTGTVSLL